MTSDYFRKKNTSRNVIFTCSKNILKFEKIKLEETIISAHMRFSSFDECNLYQNHTENIAFATRASGLFKKYLGNQNLTFSKTLGDRSLRLKLPRD